MEENGEWGGGLMTENNKFWAPQILLIILCSLGSPVSARPVEPQKHPPPLLFKLQSFESMHKLFFCGHTIWCIFLI